MIQTVAYVALVAALASLACGHHNQPLPQKALRGLWRAIRRPTGPRTPRTPPRPSRRRTAPSWAPTDNTAKEN